MRSLRVVKNPIKKAEDPTEYRKLPKSVNFVPDTPARAPQLSFLNML